VRGKRTDLVVQAKGSVTCYDPTSGEKRWQFDDESISSIASPVNGDSLILVAGREMLALRPSGNGPPEIAWRSARLSSGTATPLATAGRVYTVKDGGILACGELRSGKQVWAHRLHGSYSASPVVADGKLYLVNEEGETTVLRTGDVPQQIAISSLGDAMLATPAAARGCIFLRTDSRLFSVGQSKAGE
jgi:outer membrane protein assembly factor BamB